MKTIIVIVLFSYLCFAPAFAQQHNSSNGEENKSEINNTEVQRKNRYWAISTNMLYDLALVPNIAAEFNLGSRWTIKGNWAYNWMNNDPSHAYWRLYGGSLEVRRWLGKSSKEKPLQGHHIGLYAQAGTYDIEFGNIGNLSKISYASGLSYGYSIPISRRLNIDFEIGVGYFGGEYKEYVPVDYCYVWQADKMRHYFGPTKAEISLVWLLGHGNMNNGSGRRK